MLFIAHPTKPLLSIGAYFNTQQYSEYKLTRVTERSEITDRRKSLVLSDITARFYWTFCFDKWYSLPVSIFFYTRLPQNSRHFYALLQNITLAENKSEWELEMAALVIIHIVPTYSSECSWFQICESCM